MTTEILALSARDIIRRFKSRELSPVEVMYSAIRRAEEVEPAINAFADKYFDEAIDAAKRAEEAYLNGRARPLEGVPVAVKDEVPVEGQVMRNGSLLNKDAGPAKHTDAMVQRILDAGGIVHARTNTPEFSCAAFCANRLTGVTRNPWNPEITPGGSSGGTSASLAAGTSFLATGSDIAGSIRIPASMTGVVGFKPPHGRVPQAAPWNLDPYCHNGPLARTVSDCILFENVIAGPSADDITSLKPKYTLPTHYPDIRGLKVAYDFDLGMGGVAEDVARCTLATIERLRSLGAVIEEVNVGWDERVVSTFHAHLAGQMGQLYLKFTPAERELLSAPTLWFIDLAEKVTFAELTESFTYTAYMWERLKKVFDNYDLLICPTARATTCPADPQQIDQSVPLKGELVNSQLDWVMTTPFNALAQCPVLNVPSGLADNGVPCGIQIVGPPFDDASVFRLGMAIEKDCSDLLLPVSAKCTSVPRTVIGKD